MSFGGPMSSGQAILAEPYVWGWGTAGASLALEATGLVIDGSPLLKITAGGPSAGGHWEPVTNGDPDNPELIFADGDVVMSWVTD